MNETIHMAGPWITQHEIDTVAECMRSGWYNYHYVEKFQKEFAAYHNRKYAIMTPNCTTAIHLLLTALGIKDDDEVLVPECTWIASSAPISYLRAKPVFCDIEAENWCLDPASVRRNITKQTKAIIVVDLFGNMPLMDELTAIAREYNLHLVEDAAEALGSTYKGVRAGKFGVGSVFSFHRTKTVVTGEGGMLLLDDDALAERCMLLRDHGRRPGIPAYFNEEVTYKYMPFNLQAAMGLAQFQRIDELIAKKRWIFEEYKRQLRDIPDIQLNAEPEGVFNSVWITGLVFGLSHHLTKQDAMARFEKIGLPSRPFFYPLTTIPAYKEYAAAYRGKNPVAHDIPARGVNLPGALIMTPEQIDRVCAGVKQILGVAWQELFVSLKDQRILITGGLGFIGSNIARRCVQLGAKVSIYDCLDPHSGGNMHNVHDFEKDVDIILNDIRNFEGVSSCIRNKDILFSCAAFTSHPQSMKEPLIDIDVNCKGIINLLETIRRFNPACKMVHIGTSTQIGRMVLPEVTEHHPEFPIDIYSANKSASEKYVLCYGHAYKMSTTVIRLANVFGPRSNIRTPDFGFVNYFVGLALKNKDLTVFGKGQQLRNLSYIEDVTEALVMAATNPSANGQVLFAVADRQYSVKEIAESIAANVGGRVKFVEWPKDRAAIEVGDAIISNAKIKSVLGWSPAQDLAEGMKKTKLYFSPCIDKYL